MVVITHELASIFAIGDNSILLDPVSKTLLASGNPRRLRDTSVDSKVREFLCRGAA